MSIRIKYALIFSAIYCFFTVGIVVLCGNVAQAQIPVDSLVIWLRADRMTFKDAAFCTDPASADEDDVHCWESASDSGLKFRRIQNGNIKLRSYGQDTLNGHPSVVLDGSFGLATDPSDELAVRAMTIFLVSSNSGTGLTVAQPGTWNQAFNLNADYIMHHSQRGAWVRRDHQVDWSTTPHLITSGVFGPDEEALELWINGLRSSANLVEDII
ncbi:MAG: hypothetical protein AAFN92_22060, partial [Bacteroidota bacterium]